jgi:hypothetical protein
MNNNFTPIQTQDSQVAFIAPLPWERGWGEVIQLLWKQTPEFMLQDIPDW